MSVPAPLTSAVRAFREAGGELRRIVGVVETPYWAWSVPGIAALRAWLHLRERAEATGFWPVVVGEFAGPDAGGSEAALECLIEDARAHLELPDDQLWFRQTGRTPEEILRLAEAYPFERWVHLQRDPTYQEGEHLRKAEYFDGLGASGLADLHRQWAERWRQTAPEEFSPANYTLPPRENRNLPQHELHCVTCYDDQKRRTVVADAVTILLVPTRLSWQVPAFLLVTTKELDRPPHVHVAALRWLHERFGADLVGIEDRTLEVIPHARPTTAEDALRAAALLRAYSDCPITSENEMASVEELAVYLLESEFWTFCWP